MAESKVFPISSHLSKRGFATATNTTQPSNSKSEEDKKNGSSWDKIPENIDYIAKEMRRIKWIAAGATILFVLYQGKLYFQTTELGLKNIRWRNDRSAREYKKMCEKATREIFLALGGCGSWIMEDHKELQARNSLEELIDFITGKPRERNLFATLVKQAEKNENVKIAILMLLPDAMDENKQKQLQGKDDEQLPAEWARRLMKAVKSYNDGQKDQNKRIELRCLSKAASYIYEFIDSGITGAFEGNGRFNVHTNESTDEGTRNKIMHSYIIPSDRVLCYNNFKKDYLGIDIPIPFRFYKDQAQRLWNSEEAIFFEDTDFYKNEVLPQLQSQAGSLLLPTLSK